MSVNRLVNIGHAAVTYLNCISIKYLTQGLVFWKLFVDYFDKFLPDVWSHISTIGWIVQNNISGSISPLVVSLGCCRWSICELIDNTIVNCLVCRQLSALTIVKGKIYWGCRVTRLFESKNASIIITIIIITIIIIIISDLP